MNIKTFTDVSGAVFDIQGILRSDFTQIGDDITASTITSANIDLNIDLDIGSDFDTERNYIIFFRVGDAVTFDWSQVPNTDIRIIAKGTSYMKVYENGSAINTSSFTFDSSKLYCIKPKRQVHSGGSTEWIWQLYTLGGSSGGSTEALTTAQVNALLALI